ncbi:MAG: DeoR/GlpR transcriptional regulator [Firmicutes bacterium]|jgi:DeoR family fructose operon transcriptional repressor|nr:DeoR/GlpR transcriptional regulator [Bacillota bacterium]
MLVSQRRQRILERLYTERHVDNNELAAEFGVSVDTIRRDMRILEQKGLVTRTHGGASWVEDWELRTGLDRDPLLRFKRAIAAKARTLVPLNEPVALDIGSTTYQFARALVADPPKEPMSIITNDIRIGSYLKKVPGITVTITGGTIGDRGYLWGLLTKRSLEILYFDTAIMTTSGLTIKEGLTDPHSEVAEIKQVLIANAKRVVLLADHTKFGCRHMYHVADIKKVDMIVTDDLAPAEVLEELRLLKIRTVIVPVSYNE